MAHGGIGWLYVHGNTRPLWGKLNLNLIFRNGLSDFIKFLNDFVKICPLPALENQIPRRTGSISCAITKKGFYVFARFFAINNGPSNPAYHAIRANTYST